MIDVPILDSIYYEESDHHPELATERRGDGPWWWACQKPEHPDDEWASWSYECWSCYVSLLTSAIVHPEVGGMSHGAHVASTRTMFLEAHAFRTDCDLPTVPETWVEFALAWR